MSRTAAEIYAIERVDCKKLVRYFMHGTEFSHCASHPETYHCSKYLWTKTFIIMKTLMQINLPIHLVPFLIFKLNTLRKEGPVKPLLKLAWNIFRSVMFLTTYVQTIVGAQEIFQYPPFSWISGQGKLLTFYRRNVIACIIATLGIAWEQPHRRVDIIYYIIPRVLEIYWNMIKNRRIVKGDIPAQNAILVAIAFGVIAYKFSEEESTREARSCENKEQQQQEKKSQQHDSNSIRGFSLRVCRSLWGNHHTVIRRKELSRSQSQLDLETGQQI